MNHIGAFFIKLFHISVKRDNLTKLYLDSLVSEYDDHLFLVLKEINKSNQGLISQETLISNLTKMYAQNDKPLDDLIISYMKPSSEKLKLQLSSEEKKINERSYFNSISNSNQKEIYKMSISNALFQ